jgi:uncharacterized protein YbjT (DUF2867 family)
MILVTGANGSNGTEIVKRLSGMGATIRAMVRTPRDQAKGILPGVEIATADFDQPESVRRALEGVDRAFLVTNSSEHVEEQQLQFVQLAHEAGVGHIVYLSQLHATKDSPVRFLRYHAVVEEAISSSGMAFTHLRPNLYMQGLLAFRASIASEGRFFAPAGEARVSIVDVRDIAAVATAALISNSHEGKVYDVTEPEALTHTEIASQLSERLGKQITFTDIPDAAMRNALAGLGVPQWQADGLVEDYAHYRRGEAAAVSTAVQDVTGVPPHTLLEFARDYRPAFLV